MANDTFTTKDTFSIIEKQKAGLEVSCFKYRVLKWLEGEEEGSAQKRYQTINWKNINDELSFWDKRRKNSIYDVNIPWLAIHFENNEMGLFAGFSLVILLLLLLYNLGLRYSSLHKLFNIIDGFENKADKKLYYDLSTFSIILKLPLKSKNPSHYFLVYIPYLLFFLPILSYGYLYYTDIDSYKDISELYPKVVYYLIFEALFMLIIVVMTINIYRLDKSTDKLWDEYEAKFMEND